MANKPKSSASSLNIYAFEAPMLRDRKLNLRKTSNKFTAVWEWCTKH